MSFQQQQLTDPEAIAAVIEAVNSSPELRQMLRDATSNITVVYNGTMIIELVPRHLRPAPPPPRVPTQTTCDPVDGHCVICLDNSTQNWVSLTGCGHRFHSLCIERWFAEKPTCPMCRSRLA